MQLFNFNKINVKINSKNNKNCNQSAQQYHGRTLYQAEKGKSDVLAVGVILKQKLPLYFLAYSCYVER